MQEGQFFLLPPAADRCQTCAAKHAEHEPHDATSLYFQTKFQMENGRAPAWLDAMAHCSPELQAAWTAALTERGVDVAGGKLLPPRKRGAA